MWATHAVKIVLAFTAHFNHAGIFQQCQVMTHRRLALPLACVVLALVGIPLGISSRKGGKSTAFVLTVFLGFLYFMGLISLIGLAARGTIAGFGALSYRLALEAAARL